MNPEKFHDAMNHLDDDLIAETDELRQGRRTRPVALRIVPAVAAAACLALVVTVGPRLMPAAENGAATGSILQDAENPLTGDRIWGGAEIHIQESQSEYIVKTVSCGDISMEIPQTWSCEAVNHDDGSYFLHICPPGEEGVVRVGYWPGFGVCGTGLTTEEAVIAGMEATVGTFDGGPLWSFITFGEDYVVINEGADAWWSEWGGLFMKCLESLVIGGNDG